MMLEVRSYEGSPEELSDFVFTQWRASYGGRMAVPRWTGDYFRWQLRMDEPEQRRYLVAAYDGTRLAGVVPYFPMQFHLDGEAIAASQASWLSVSPDFRGQGVAGKLIESSRTLHREQGLRFQLGFAYYGHQSSQAPKFWLRKQTATTAAIRKVGFWVRVLDPPRAAAWNPDSFQHWVTRLTAPFCGIPRILSRPGLVIRPAEPRDLQGCLNLAEQSTRHCRLRLLWDEESLGRIMGLHGFSQSLVAEESGELRGCISFHFLPLVGRTEELFGIMDLVLVSRLSPAARVELLNSALLSMKQQGAVTAMKLRVADYPRGLFTRLGWIPRPSDSHVLITWAGAPEQLPRLGRMHILWR
jgi:predicted N-acetyltransferase YhbS